MSRCRSCDKPIEWVSTPKGSRPVNPGYIAHDDAEEGDVLITDGGNTITVSKGERRPSIKGRIAHFSTCEEGGKWQRHRGGRA